MHWWQLVSRHRVLLLSVLIAYTLMSGMWPLTLDTVGASAVQVFRLIVTLGSVSLLWHCLTWAQLLAGLTSLLRPVAWVWPAVGRLPLRVALVLAMTEQRMTTRHQLTWQEMLHGLSTVDELAWQPTSVRPMWRVWDSLVVLGLGLMIVFVL
ncbi:hypothetical protein [Chitinivorax sp. B]|uniref:hypothetical protein n=1 Tax=Chitinivorax sp. B TaxID=2502235 RepID=UPI0010F81EEF|nr:hypothetical protein [Chitinivorax sp. B]